MAQNEALAAKVRAALAHLPNVHEKKMFRGTAFLVNDKLCLSTGDDELMLRFDPALQDDILQKPGTRVMTMKGRVYNGYAYVKESALASPEAFDYWIRLALDYNPKAKSSKKKKEGR